MKIDLKGNTSQEGTPTPETPQDIHVVSGNNSIVVCGENLLDETYYNNSSLYIKYGNYFAYVELPDIFKTKFYVNMNLKGTSQNLVYGFTDTLSGTFSGGIKVLHNGTLNTNVECDFTNAEHVYMAIGNGNGITLAPDIPKIFDNYNIMISTTSNEPYEPYQSQSYPITLPEEMFLGWIPNTNYYDKIDKSNGKNLFDIDNDLHYSTDASGNTTTTAYFNSTDYISCNSGDSFTISGIPTTTSDYNFKVVFFDSSKNYISRTIVQAGTTNVRNNFSTTAPTNAKYVMAQFYNTIKEGQFEKGSTATEYEPYGTGWYVKKEIGKVVLDGSENWQLSSDNGFLIYASATTFSQRNKTVYNGFSDKFSIEKSSSTWTNNYYCGWNSYNDFWLKDNDYNTVADFKTWLGSNNTTVYYVLNTPTYIEITDTTLISQLNALKKATSYNGQTNISQNNNDLPFTIKAKALIEF